MAPTAASEPPRPPGFAAPELQGAGEWQDAAALPPRYRVSVEGMRALSQARLYGDHEALGVRHLDPDVVWDVPTHIAEGRPAMLSVLYSVKWAMAGVDLEPVLFRLVELSPRRSLLELALAAHLRPRRPWWGPGAWALPEEALLRIREVIHVSLGPSPDGSDDVITRIQGTLDNWGGLPWPIRWLNGLLFGSLPAATRPLWAPLAAAFDPSLRPPSQHAAAALAAARRHTAATTAAATAGVCGAANGAAEAATARAAATARDAAAAVVRAGEAMSEVFGAGSALGAAAGSLGGAVASAAQGAGAGPGVLAGTAAPGGAWLGTGKVEM
ncbi:hypothetical protein HYH03_014876 [Edaphochlamys debaryana]|uniref:Uncharacterized protein n=1 Tax=Edaphochlamys debaryana TaxID=47281 RepID=A0A836BT29_9CHLO|nr:hypothetical protein HYH03_014876 [Edaphochlamys debaryana]|eukprot:KAG2486429.1 hypothetical protein HYH03_014876 [Edaphochlamys debaryana]